MSISAALSIASSEIGNLTAQISLVSHNIANAGTPGYSVEEIAQTSLYAGGVGMGAVNGTVGRAVARQTQADLLAQNSTVAGLLTQQTALQQIDAASGAVGSGTDIGSLLGALSNGFSALAGDPANQAQQQRVVSEAGALTRQINTVSNAVQAQRQAAQNGVAANVASLNTTLAALGSLSQQIMVAKAAGTSTADLENARDAQMGALSQLVAVRFYPQPNGDLQAITASGLSLPLHGATPPFSTQAAAVSANSYAPGGGVPPILLNGQDVTSQLTGGQLGGNLTLRDTTLPTIQASLDEFSATLSQRFAAQGLSLFTDAAGNVPVSAGVPVQSGYVGYGASIQVNPAVTQNPSLVRDGTGAVVAGAGGASAFTPNPPGGPAGFNTLILRIVQNALGTQASASAAQPAPSVSGLGPSGTLSAGFVAPADLAGFATAITAAEAQGSAATTAQLTTAQSTQTMLASNLTSATSVSIDSEMSQIIVLQNAYGANAHVITAIQSMFSALLQAVQ